MADNPIFYSPKGEDRNSVLRQASTSLSSFKLSEGELNCELARLDGIPVSNDDLSLKEWYDNWLVTPDDKKVSRLIFFDTETHKLHGYLVSIGIVEYDLKEKKVVNTFYSLVNPLCPIDKEAQGVHGISDEMVQNSPAFKDIYHELKEMFQRNEMIVAFNSSYDINALIRECDRLEVLPFVVMPFLDLMQRLKVEVNAKASNNRLKFPRLDEAANYFGIQSDETSLHNSLYDTQITLKVFEEALKRYSNNLGNFSQDNEWITPYFRGLPD